MAARHRRAASVAFGFIFRAQHSTSSGREQLAIGFLFGLGLLLGLAVAPVIARTLWVLLALIVLGIVAIFVSIPGSNVIYAVLGLGRE